ncbi:MAG: hypothetical protein RIQ33_634, partial [Bacteroidota bacterium]
TDCNDNNASIHIGNTFYIDNDGDGFGSNVGVILCNTSAPTGYSANNTDCNDNNSAIHSATLIPTVSIVVSPSAIVTQGTSVTFTATTTNGGSSPIYQWQKNTNLVGANSNTYATTPVNADSIWCLINSNAQCISNANATSNKIKMVVTSSSSPSVGGNDNPCGAINSSANTGSIAGLPTVISAYDNGSSVYGGNTNATVTNNPPSGPSLVYYTGNNSGATSINDPVCSCTPTGVGYIPKTVWFKFRVPTFAAGVTLRSITNYGQLFNANIAVYSLLNSSTCTNPNFNFIQCSSTGVLVLSATDLANYQGQYLYIQLQGTATNPSGAYTLSIQGTVPDISLTHPTSTSIRVNFPSISSTNLKYVLYWQRVGTSGVSYVNLAAVSQFTINGLISGSNYKVWVKYIDMGHINGSAIYSDAKTLGTISGCNVVLPAPTITPIANHCAQVNINFTNPPSAIPTALIPPSSSFPIRVIYTLNGSSRGWVQAFGTFPSAGYQVSNLLTNSNYSFFYSYKCIGGAISTSSFTNYTSCNGPARLDNTHHEYLINNVYHVDCELEDLIAASMPNNVDDGQLHEFEWEEIKSKNSTSDVSIMAPSFSITPQPADLEISIHFDDEINDGTIKISNLLGEEVYQLKNINQAAEQKLKIDISTFESGIYIFELIHQGKTESQKIIISR